ncbi:MAG TPA: hypothetical protein VFX48_05535, partial [Saprospiraceae bacterium]|nr:hypothetical protein [Saprospiraceae bacterium]
MSVTNKASLNYFSILFLFTCLNLSAQSVSKPAASAFLPNACGITVNAGPDITICAGQAKNLNGSVVGSTNYSWEPIDGLSNPNILNPSANPMSTTTYTLTARATSNNLITNGGFETGSIAPATSQYTAFTNVNTFITSTGGYMIMSVPQIAMAFGCNPSIGAFALVVTPTGSGQNIWCQTIPVNPNTDYKIDYKVFGIPYIFGSPPSIGIKANGSLIGVVDAISGLCQQADGNFIWNSGAATSCTFCLANYGGQGPGSMCAIDDIIIRECCEEKDEVTVEVYELVAEAAPVEDIDCLNRPVTIDASGSSQGPGISYQWSTRNGHIVRGERTLMLVVDTPGIYTLKITGLYGCEKELMVQVNGSVTPPDITIKKTDIDCKNPLGSLEGSSKSSSPRFEWNGPNGFFSTRSILNNLKEPGEYTLKVTDAFGCESTARVELLDNRSLLEAEILGDSISCGKDTALLKANSIARKPIYNWRGPGGIKKDSSDQLVTRDSGWYFLTTTDSLGCSETDSFYVKNLAGSLPLSIAADTLTCSRLEVILQLTTDTSAFVSWTGPNGFTSMQKQPKVSEPGWYYIVVSTPSGCRAVDSIQVFQSSDLPDISLSGKDTISCYQPSVLLSGGSSSAGARWEWITPNGTFQDSVQLHASDSGLYTLIVTGMNGCKVSRSISVIKDIDPPGIIIQNDTLSCIKNQLALNATVTNSRSYQWSGPNGFTSTFVAPLITQPGNYTLTVTGLNGCQSSATLLIVEDKVPPALQLQADTINCLNPSITPLVQSDSTAIAYRWSGPNGFSSSMQTPLLNQGGNYQLRVTGKNGCESTGFLQVIVDLTKPSANLESDTIQCKGIAEIRALNISPGAAINWMGPNGFSSSSATAVISISGYYVLQLTGTNGCIFIDSIFAFQKDQLPDIFAFDDTLSCKATRLFINAGSNTPNVIFQWTGPNGFMSDIARPEVTDSGSYTLRVIDANGCEAVRQIHIAKRTELPILQILPSNNQISCLDSLVTLLAQSNPKTGTLVWSGPNGFSSGLDSIQIREPGTYILQFTSEFGCTSSDTVTIADFRSLPTVTVADDSINCIRTNVTLSLNTNDTGLNFLWSGPNNFSSTEQKPRINNGGTYSVTVSNAFGCTITRSIR